MELRATTDRRTIPGVGGPGQPTPAALVSGDVPASTAPHPLSVFDMFRIGIGPSSSHTVGPMRAGLAFATELASLLRSRGIAAPARVTVDLHGSLGATGRGHNTDRAVLLGLGGHAPESVDIDTVEALLPHVARTGTLPVAGVGDVGFDVARDIRFLPASILPYHVNALTLTALGVGAEPLLERTYYSVGGGFVMVEVGADPAHPQVASLAAPEAALTASVPAPYPFSTSEELLTRCEETGLDIASLVRANEESMRPAEAVDTHLDTIANTMFDCVDAGVAAHGILPGGLDVPRRARALAEKLSAECEPGAGGAADSPRGPWVSPADDPMRAMDWVNLFALAVNEENAAGHRVVTAPTNGAAGVIPAVLGHLVTSWPQAGGAHSGSHPRVIAEGPDGALAPMRPHRLDPDCDERRRRAVHDFLLAATAIGALIKTNASIAGAEVGCQGEVGSASAMAAAGLAQALGGTPRQVENAAEIAMEHSLGLTCDPVAGLVQIPCIERNAIAAVKAINAARMALWGDGRHTVSLDVVIETMRQTGNDMLSKYKETSAGGLAVNVVEC